MGNKREIIEEVRKIDGAELYGKAMERVLEGAVDTLRADLRAMKKLMSERQRSITALDAIKKRYNVLVQFLQKTTRKEKDETSADALKMEKLNTEGSTAETTSTDALKADLLVGMFWGSWESKGDQED
jgi:hypothetical protein